MHCETSIDMNLSLLQTLTWSTVAGAIVSALALASVEPVVPGYGRTAVAGPAPSLPLPTEPTAAGPSAQPTASAAGKGETVRVTH